MKRFLMLVYLVFSGFFLAYLAIPNLPFPDPIPNSVTSVEPADSETLERRAYFTNYNRQEVLEHYQNQFKLSFFGIDLPSYRLTYPPEDAYPLIRDQTRSTHLEEIVYPFRESFFVNEFVPKEAKDDIWYKGTHYEQKVTVMIKQSGQLARISIGLIIILVTWFTLSHLVKTITVFVKTLITLKWPFF